MAILTATSGSRQQTQKTVDQQKQQNPAAMQQGKYALAQQGRQVQQGPANTIGAASIAKQQQKTGGSVPGRGVQGVSLLGHARPRTEVRAKGAPTALLAKQRVGGTPMASVGGSAPVTNRTGEVRDRAFAQSDSQYQNGYRPSGMMAGAFPPMAKPPVWNAGPGNVNLAPGQVEAGFNYNVPGISSVGNVNVAPGEVSDAFNYNVPGVSSVGNVNVAPGEVSDAFNYNVPGVSGDATMTVHEGPQQMPGTGNYRERLDSASGGGGGGGGGGESGEGSGGTRTGRGAYRSEDNAFFNNDGSPKGPAGQVKEDVDRIANNLGDNTDLNRDGVADRDQVDVNGDGVSDFQQVGGIINEAALPNVDLGGGGGGGGPRDDIVKWLQGQGYDFGKGMTDAFISPAAGIADSMNNAAEISLKDYYNNFDQLDGIKKWGAEMMDPAAQAASEAAARDSLYAGVNSQRDSALRMSEAKSNRGGVMGTGSQQGLYNAAMQQAQEGERGLKKDAFGRQLAAGQAGAAAQAGAAGLQYGLMEDQFSSPEEYAAMLMELAPELLEFLQPPGPFPGG